MRITFNKLNRRTHLYLGLVLAPWFLIYAASSVVLNHRSWFEPAGGNQPEWTTRFDRPYRMPPLADDTNEDLMAEQILRDNGLTGRYRYHWDEAENFVVQRTRLLRTIRFTWFPAQHRLLAEDKRFRLTDSLTSAHFRAGYGQPYWIETAWAVFIDLVVVGTLAWILTGLCLWFKLKRLRFWGWVAIGSGTVCFLATILLM